MQMEERRLGVGGRFGFNGKEMDNEMKGEGNSLDFGAKMYDSRVGRWMSLDPLLSKYPDLSPYNFVANSPIRYVDPDGKIIRIYYTNSDYYDYTPMVKPKVDNDLLKDVHQAVTYNMNTRIGKVVWNYLHKANEVLEIRPNDLNENKFVFKGGSKTIDGKPALGTLFWDYNSPSSVETSQTEGSGIKYFWGGYIKGYFSPATIIFHESGHAYFALIALLSDDVNAITKYKADEKKEFSEDAEYGTKGEGNNITKLEHKYIREINAYEQESNPNNPQYQPIRYNHKGKTLTKYETDPVKVNEVFNSHEYKNWRNEYKGRIDFKDGIKD